jgi:hypothetical protein
MKRMLSWSQKIEARTFLADFCTGIFWGGVGHYAATPLIVALSPGHSDITRFHPWSPIATGSHLDRTKKNSKSWSDNWHHWRSWSAFRHFGTHFVESCCMSESSWMMDPIRSREMPSCWATYLAEIWRVFQDMLVNFIYRGWSLFWVIQDEAHHRWKNHHV